ncbi:transferase family-domain-containing protein, partial [Pisolithus tinctorius]
IPKLPTVLHDQAAVELPGYDLWLAYVDNVHVIPGVIELERFESALSQALSMYPSAAGRMRCCGGRWSIELTNSGVPLDVSYERERPLSSVLQNDYVLQEDLSPLLSCHSDGADIVDKERPLLCLKLTFFEEETCIGVSWHHALGDAIATYRFMHTFSQLYQCKLPEFPSFTFKKYDFPPPSDEIATKYHDKIRHLHDPYPSAELGAAFFEANAGVQNLQWRFSGEELRRLRVMVNESGYQALSTQDCLTAYIVTVFNLVQEKPIRIVTNVCNYRGVSAPFIEENVAGNAFSNAIADRLPVDIAGIASAIHMSIMRTRDAQYLGNYLSVAGDRMLNQANLGKVFLFPPHDDVIVGNSNTCIDWCNAHFGFPDGTRFHTCGFSKFYLRSFRSNPVKGADNTWHARAGSVDISIGVPIVLKARLEEIFSRGFQLEEFQDRHAFTTSPQSPRIYTLVHSAVSRVLRNWIGWI